MSPPSGVIGYCVIQGDGIKPALFPDRGQAVDYATRTHGTWWPMVCAKRRDDGTVSDGAD